MGSWPLLPDGTRVPAERTKKPSVFEAKWPDGDYTIDPGQHF